MAMFDDDGTPAGITLAVGAVVIVAAAALAGQIPRAETSWRCGVMALTLGLFAAFTVAPLALTAMVVPTWMITNGFLVNQFGVLSWHGQADLDRLLTLTAAVCVGLAIGAAGRQLRAARDRWELGASVEAMKAEMTKETNQSA
jgi:hypothetical protein